MTERPILFSAPMVRAILAGAKTQTRRALHRQPVMREGQLWWTHNGHTYWQSNATAFLAGCRYGIPGDRLWVREKCQARERTDGLDGVQYFADDSFRPIDDTKDAAERWVKLNHYGGKRRGSNVPGIHMPRWASRITLEVTGVRVERLQDITRGDAMDEGCPFPNMAKGDDPRQWYSALWESINGAGSWDANPWVWAVEFRRC